MKKINFNWDKNIFLKNTRWVCFEDVVDALEEGNLLDIVQHISRPHQKIMIVQIKNYVYEIPFVESDTEYFLKTIYPSRKFKKIYNIT